MTWKTSMQKLIKYYDKYSSTNEPAIVLS